LAIRSDADASMLACFPIPPCAPCAETGPAPEAFCAADGHCALKGRDRRDGALSGTCFSPIQNLVGAYATDAVGCDCEPHAAYGCATDMLGRNVGLVCDDAGHWLAVEDGPCGPYRR
jgi:hypothetical protein